MEMTLHLASALSTTLEKVVEAYRLGMEGEASEHLVKLIDLLTSVLAKAPPEMVMRINPVLAKAISAIERKDYLYVADTIEYEIAPLLLSMNHLS
jgi:hypothetical protein